MSKVNISVDTKLKELSVSVDGEVVENVISASVYNDDCGFGVGIYIDEKLGDMKKRIHLCAAESDHTCASVKDNDKAISSEIIKGWFELPNQELANELSKLFK